MKEEKDCMEGVLKDIVDMLDKFISDMNNQGSDIIMSDASSPSKRKEGKAHALATHPKSTLFC